MIVSTVEQGTAEWLSLRVGRFTASNAGDAFAKIRTGWAASRKNLIMRIVLERLTQKPQGEDFVSPAMTRGTELEPAARRAYEAATGHLVERVGFICHDTLMAGGSPDGLIDADGVLELKCPGAAVHLEYLKGAIPVGHLLQVTHLLWLTGRKWADLTSYHPDFPESLRLATRRITPAPDDIRGYDANAREFLTECQREYEALLTLSDPAGRLAAAVEAK